MPREDAASMEQAGATCFPRLARQPTDPALRGMNSPRGRFRRLCSVALCARFIRRAQREMELRSFLLFTLDPDSPAVRFHNSLRDWQAEACAEARGAFGLPVRIENLVEILARDSRSCVGHGEDHEAVGRFGAA